MMEPEQAAAVQTPDDLITIDFNAVYTSCMDPATGCLLTGETIATTIETGFFLLTVQLKFVYLSVVYQQNTHSITQLTE
jgi:hypothetical protein